ncbi:unnamed protein product, partial [Ectocarpus sp. 13 AM-2016]
WRDDFKHYSRRGAKVAAKRGDFTALRSRVRANLKRERSLKGYSNFNEPPIQQAVYLNGVGERGFSSAR